MTPGHHQSNKRGKINCQDFQIPIHFHPQENDNDHLNLSLSLKLPSIHPQLPVQPPASPLLPDVLPEAPPFPDVLPKAPPSLSPLLSSIPAPNSPCNISIINPPPQLFTLPRDPSGRGSAVPFRPPRPRRNPTQAPRAGKSTTVVPPFPWATNLRATVHSISHLLSNQIHTISGEVQCRRCDRRYTMDLDLREKFSELWRFIADNKSQMHDRAPGIWMNPILPTCRFCDQENSVKPLISEKKKTINWLFLLLGQMLGCCTLGQLKYFCKHTKNHRTGAKDRVLYLTYLALCKQLEPNGPFNI